MNEQGWLASDDPAAMLWWYTGRTGDGSRDLGNDISDRMLRLFACACCRMRGTPDAVVDGYEVDLMKLGPDEKIIRFVNSY